MEIVASSCPAFCPKRLGLTASPPVPSAQDRTKKLLPRQRKGKNEVRSGTECLGPVMDGWPASGPALLQPQSSVARAAHDLSLFVTSHCVASMYSIYTTSSAPATRLAGSTGRRLPLRRSLRRTLRAGAVASMRTRPRWSLHPPPRPPRVLSVRASPLMRVSRCPSMARPFFLSALFSDLCALTDKASQTSDFLGGPLDRGTAR